MIIIYPGIYPTRSMTARIYRMLDGCFDPMRDGVTM